MLTPVMKQPNMMLLAMRIRLRMSFTFAGRAIVAPDLGMLVCIS